MIEKLHVVSYRCAIAKKFIVRRSRLIVLFSCTWIVNYFFFFIHAQTEEKNIILKIAHTFSSFSLDIASWWPLQRLLKLNTWLSTLIPQCHVPSITIGTSNLDEFIWIEKRNAKNKYITKDKRQKTRKKLKQKNTLISLFIVFIHLVSQ